MEEGSTSYELFEAQPTQRAMIVLRTAGPLILAIAGSALTPLPCAFSLTGVGVGTVVLLLIGIANLYTTVLMARAAARCGTSGYEEVIERAGGPVARRYCQAALFVLLFGSSCTCLSVIQETGVRAVAELALHVQEGSSLLVWIASTPSGNATLISTLTALLLLPLSLASMGELLIVSLLGVMMMLILCAYVLWLAFELPAVYTDERFARHLAGQAASTAEPSTLFSSSGISTAASTFGYAFYIQPCALPLLRTLPKDDLGADLLADALYVTFAFTAAAYLVVGLGGLSIFGQGHVPQDLLQGFQGRVGGMLSGFFCLYLCLCFPPIVVPLREVLVRLWRRQHAAGTQMQSCDSLPMSARLPLVEGEAAVTTRVEGDSSPEVVVVRRGNEAANGVDDSAADASTLPPMANALLTAALVGCALLVALWLPDASSTLFALTGATGVCAISYLFPIYAYWNLSEADGGVAVRHVHTSHDGRKARWRHQQRGLWRALTAAVRLLIQRVWPATVLLLGVSMSALTLIAVVGGADGSSTSAAVCATGSELVEMLHVMHE